MNTKILLLGCCAALALEAQTAPAARQIGAAITADGLKADISFLASDAMRGRGTPSPEQDIAAEYIASEFRRAGLEAVGDDGYFQNVKLESYAAGSGTVDLTITVGGTAVHIAPAELTMAANTSATEVEDAEALRVTNSGKPALNTSLSGKIALVDSGVPFTRLNDVKLALLLRSGPLPRGEQRTQFRQTGQKQTGPAILLVSSDALRAALAATPDAPVKVRVKITAPPATPVTLRNVVGLLRGSDPALKDTALIISAHYDHMGVRATGDDRIFNGANDNASGTAALFEMARALAALPERPRRSILFVALCAEEIGEFGSAWYVQHPLIPLEKTVADVNMEQLGRTDDNEGPRVKQFNLTGFDYSNISDFFATAAKEYGVEAVKDPKNSDSFFGRSDNAAFAARGVPSTTVSVSYVFPDYHAVGDEWAKIDYGNMALVTRALALGALEIANSPEAPHWNAENPKTVRYVKARQPAPPAQ